MTQIYRGRFKYVLSKLESKELIDTILTPYSKAYNILKNRKYAAISNAGAVNDLLLWLNKIDNSDWMPSAIRFFAEHENEPDYILWFTQKLERLASYMHITAKDVNKRIERYKLILEEMENHPDSMPDDPVVSVELTNSEKAEFVSVLNGYIYKLTGKRRNYVILRLNAFVGDGTPIDFSPALLTIEHVLPQTVDPASEWTVIWPDESIREKWVHKIANLVPLTRPKNSAAQNYDFNQKKKIYFTGKGGTTAYPLTTQVVSELVWEVSTVQNRQLKLINTFTNEWDLAYTSGGNVAKTSDGEIVYHITLRGSKGTGHAQGKKFVVHKGTEISSDTVQSFQKYYLKAYELRCGLIKNGTIQNNTFTQDYVFDSISLATSVVIGRTANGYLEWKDDSGSSFNDNVK